MTSPLIELLRRRAQEKAAVPAIRDGRRSVTFRELETLTRRWAARFALRGISPGDPVLVYVPPSIELYAILLALWWRGAVAVFADAWTTRHRMSLVTAQVSPRLFVAIPRALILRAFSSELRDVPVEILWPWRQLPAAEESGDPTRVAQESSALVTFTTGSSGTPKGADRTHRFLLAQHQALTDALGEIPAGPELVTLPIFGLHALAAGRTCQLAPISHARPSRYNPRHLLRDIARHQPASIAASPAVFETLMAYLEDTGRTVPQAIHLHAGGAAVTPVFMRRMRRVFPHAILKAVYGSTEAEPIALLDGDELAQRDESADTRDGLPVGRPFEGINVQIIPADLPPPGPLSAREWRSLSVGRGETGEICVAGEHVLTRYYKNALANAAQKICVDGVVWHRTGDAGSWLADGSLCLHGTVAQSFDWEGRTWYPFVFELQLDALAGIRKSTVICAKSGPVVCLETQGSIDKRRLESDVRRLALPFDWILRLGCIPRDPRHNSKIDHNLLRRLVEETP
jgi:acyl-CoA synthetase (AMP-forming)/AMP-acid ligase II